MRPEHIAHKVYTFLSLIWILMSDVVVIGAGIAGAGIARDLALRGVGVTLVEKDAPAAGATGRCHGLLHSGARYAVKDPSSAAECARENLILRNIAPLYTEGTGGLFLAVSEEEAAYGDTLQKACKAASIPLEEISPSGSPNPAALRCMRTNDGSVDPFLLTLSNLYDAHKNGARIMTHACVKDVHAGYVRLSDGMTLKADVVVNAAGHECGALVPGLAIQPNKGTILVTERRVCDMVVNRMRMPGNGDIVVPGHTTSLIGTTSLNSTGTLSTRDEYRELIREAIKLIPSIKNIRIVRAFSGVRPLAGSGDGRELSRDYRIFEDDGIVTVAGGKLTTYRLIAEQAADTVMRLLGAGGGCRTKSVLPDILNNGPSEGLLCNCESAKRRVIDIDFLKPEDLWKYNRLGFGACQGMRCAKNTLDEPAFLEERWKGEKPVLDESQLKQAYISWASYMSKTGGS